MDRLKVATIWLGGCSGCHMSFLDLDEFLIDLADKIEIVFSPVVDTTKKGVGSELFRDPKEAKTTSPSQNIRRGLPPSILFQGTHDRVVDPASVTKFQRVMKRGNL